NMRFTSLSISIHIIDKERRKYSAHFMMWLNSYRNTVGGQHFPLNHQLFQEGQSIVGVEA
ncbi:hypothetical protein, partial [Geobacillus thermoleovorans]|uniref:hypothetical protein n=1 Tax=Geobacillus thermoleovorans TaxID=33941 RepID=UPI001A99FCAF